MAKQVKKCQAEGCTKDAVARQHNGVHFCAEHAAFYKDDFKNGHVPAKLNKHMTNREKLLASSNQLSEVVSQFLNHHVYMYIKLEKTRNDREVVDVTSSPLETRHMGVAQFIFTEFTLGSFGSIWEDMEDGKAAGFDLHASYKHPKGGSNGHALGIGDRNIFLKFTYETATWAITLR